MSTPAPAILGPFLHFIRDQEFGLVGTLNRTLGQNTLGEASFHVPTLTLPATDPQIIAGKIRIPPNYPLPTFQLQKYQFDIVAINDPALGGVRGSIPTPAERPDLWEVWPGTSTLVVKDFWFVDFFVDGNMVLHTTRPGLVSSANPPALVLENTVFQVSRSWGGAPGQWTQVTDLANGTYEVQIRTNPAVIASDTLVFGLTKNAENVVVLNEAPVRRLVINVFVKPT